MSNRAWPHGAATLVSAAQHGPRLLADLASGLGLRVHSYPRGRSLVLLHRTQRITLNYMSTTLTVRTDEGLRRALKDRAELEGKTLSALVREILEDALVARRVEDRVGHLKGRLQLPDDDGAPWRRQIRQRNWRK